MKARRRRGWGKREGGRAASRTRPTYLPDDSHSQHTALDFSPCLMIAFPSNYTSSGNAWVMMGPQEDRTEWHCLATAVSTNLGRCNKHKLGREACEPAQNDRSDNWRGGARLDCLLWLLFILWSTNSDIRHHLDLVRAYIIAVYGNILEIKVSQNLF
jgi:hypothetical protein